MECLFPQYLHQHDIQVPCGKCGFCLANKRADWSQRLMVEWKQHYSSSFTTLTYANPHLVWRNGQSQLEKKHLQLWFKRVRKAGYKFRYFAVGEYGSQTYRPHYHVLIFGDVPEEVIRKSWDYGEIHIGQVSGDSVGYCTKYVINSKHYNMKRNRAPPFSIMSRKPGIGQSYLTPAMIKWHKSGRKNYMLIDGKKRRLPRYYKEKIFSKIDRVRIANRANRDGLEALRAELLRLGKYHSNPMEYREERLLAFQKRIKEKSHQNLTI